MASPEIMEFILSNADDPSLVQLGIVRDNDARANFTGGERLYLLYEQGSAVVIKARATHAAAQQGAVASRLQDNAGSGTHFCDFCQSNKHDFARHNQEIHVKDPVLAFFCPRCDHKIYRNSEIEYDVHLAGAHLDFRGRHGQEVSRQSNTRLSDLKRFQKNTLVFLANATSPHIADIKQSQLKLRGMLSSAGLLDGHPQLRDSTWPMHLDFNNPHIDLSRMNKRDLCVFISDVRLQLNNFSHWIGLAQSALNTHHQTSQTAAQSGGPALDSTYVAQDALDVHHQTPQAIAWNVGPALDPALDPAQSAQNGLDIHHQTPQEATWDVNSVFSPAFGPASTSAQAPAQLIQGTPSYEHPIPQAATQNVDLAFPPVFPPAFTSDHVPTQLMQNAQNIQHQFPRAATQNADSVPLPVPAARGPAFDQVFGQTSGPTFAPAQFTQDAPNMHHQTSQAVAQDSSCDLDPSLNQHLEQTYGPISGLDLAPAQLSQDAPSIDHQDQQVGAHDVDFEFDSFFAAALDPALTEAFNSAGSPSTAWSNPEAYATFGPLMEQDENLF